MIDTLKQYVTVENSIHAVMISAALASIGNVSSYFVATGHNFFVASMMALTLGTAVCTSAIMLTKIDMMKQRHRYIAALSMVLCLVCVSGFVQSRNYIAHGNGMWSALALGFGIVFAFECLTAILLSVYQSAERMRKLDEADQGLELKLAETFAETLDNIDPNKSVQYYERHIHKILKSKADDLVSKYIPEPAHVPEPTETTPESAKSNSIADYKQEADQRRQDIMNNKLNAVREYFTNNPEATQAKAGRDLGIAKSTMSGYVKQLNGSIKR